ncbi:MAG: T9SS type A sorting domain-containing protein [candidate division Zixibacteria bacterium]|nr:T9SS type A sorting domain-containing protein [candidate division Zixibacteria bacterium]
MRVCVKLFLIIGLFLTPTLIAFENNESLYNMQKSPIYFTQNKGQFAKEVQYLCQSSGTQQFVTTAGLTYMLPRETEESKLNRKSKPESIVGSYAPHLEYYALKIEFKNTNKAITIKGENKLPWVSHYFQGRDPSKGITNVPNYEKIVAPNIYNGIDLAYYEKNGMLEYDLIVSPYGNPSDISIKINGADSLIKNNEGQLEIHTPFGEVIQSTPVTYQKINGKSVEIKSAFIINDNNASISFDVGDYNTELPLVIDPTYRFSYLYGSANDALGGVDMDTSGNIYVTGRTESVNFPATIGTYQGDYDVFVAKLTGAGSKIWVAYIGGSDEDKGRDVAVGPFDKVYLTGSTKSTNFPMAGGSIDDTYDGNGGLNAFVMYLSPAGDVVQYSTYIGGYTVDLSNIGIEDDKGTVGYAIEVDDAGYFYVAGGSNTSGFAGTVGAFDETYHGLTTMPGPSVVYYPDAFVCKFTPVGAFTGGGFFTFLGGYGMDVATGIDIDDIGNIYVSGFTSAPTTDPEEDNAFPYVEGSFYIYSLLGRTTFVTKLLPDGSDLVYSIPCGGANIDCYGMGVAVDDNYCAFVTGFTGTFNSGISIPFWVTANAFDTSFNASRADDAFVYKVNQDGSDIVWSTLLGGEGDDRAYAIDVDETGSPYVTGITYSDDFPLVDPGNLSIPYTAPPSNLFLAKIDPSGSNLDFSGKFGTVYEDYHFGPACVYNDQVVAFSGFNDIPVLPTQTDGFVYIFDVNDLYQPMVFNSINLSQPSLFPALQGISNKKILTIEINMTGVLNPMTVTEFSLSTNGTANPTTNITDARLFYLGSSIIIDTSQQFGSTVVSPSGSFNITGNQYLRSGINRFILTYGISGTAIVGDSIDAECLSVIIDGSAYIPAITAPHGGSIVAATQSGLTGTGLVGPGGDFADINDVLNSITQYGLAGDLVLELTPGQHYGQIQLPSKKGTSKSNIDQRAAGNVVFQSHGAPNSAELMFFATDSMSNYVIQANWPVGDTMFIRNLKITALGDEYATAIELTEGACNFYFENNIINGTTVSGGPMKHKALAKTWTWGGYNTNIAFKGNTFNDGVAGIFMEYGLDSNFVDSNTFNNQMMYGVYLYEHFNPYIGKNTFNSTLPNMPSAAIAIAGGHELVTVEKNVIGTSYASGITLSGSIGGAGPLRALISNNFVSLTNNTPVGGIRCISSQSTDIFNNNVNITSTHPNSACLITQMCSGLQLVNNTLVNSGGGFTHIDIPAKKTNGAAKITALDWSDYNDFYSTGPYLASINSIDIADLAEYKSTTGTDEHSISVDPGFVSVTDLHTTSPELVGVGIYLDRVPDDIDGNPRDPNNPSIGGGVYTPTSIEDNLETVLPEKFNLYQNYPNPFNPTTIIEFEIQKQSDVEITVFNILGRKIRSLVSENLSAGKYTARWDGTNESGISVASGIYFYSLRIGELTKTKKMVLLK